MIRYFTSAVVMMAAACTTAPAHATTFLRAIEDVPLLDGLTEKPDPIVFESDQGRVVRTTAEGQISGPDIAAYYRASLPALGWQPVAGDAGLFFAREHETLRINVREPRSNQPVQVAFELIVTLASSRLTD